MTTITTTGTHQPELIASGHELGYNRSLLGELLSQPSSEDFYHAGVNDRTATATTGAIEAGQTQHVRYAPMESHESPEEAYPSWENSFDFFSDFWNSEPGLHPEDEFSVYSPGYSGPSMVQLGSPQVVNDSSVGGVLPFASRFVQDTQTAEHVTFNSTEYELQFNQTKSEEVEEEEEEEDEMGEGAVGNIQKNNISNDSKFLSPARKRTIQETLSKRSANSLGHVLDSKVIPDKYNGSIAIPKPPLVNVQDYTNDPAPSLYSTGSVTTSSMGCPSYLSTSMSSLQTLSTSFDSAPEKRTNPSTPGTSVWRLNNGELINEIPTKRRRTETEKAVTARIRKGGGACNSCKKNHRACKIEHLGIQDAEKHSEQPETASRDSSWRMSDARLPADPSVDYSFDSSVPVNDLGVFNSPGSGGLSSHGENNNSFLGPNKRDFTANFQGIYDTELFGQSSYQPEGPLLDTRLFTGKTPYDVHGSDLDSNRVAFQDILDGFNPFEF